MMRIINVRDVLSPAFVNHTFCSGKSGSGKTNAMEYLVENYLIKGKVKCIDFDTSGRFENTTYSLPEDNPALISLMQDHPDLVTHHDLRPRGFNDEVILFCGRGLYYNNELPKNFKVMSFREEDLSWEYLNILLGGTEALRPTLNSMQVRFGKDITLRDIKEIIFNKTFRGEKTSFNIKSSTRDMMKVRIDSWIATGMFSDNVEKIDFQEILNDKSRITCINTFLLEQEWEEQIAIGLFMDKIISLTKSRKVNHRVLVYLREVSDYMDWQLCKEGILKILRKGRFFGKYGIDLYCDTQRAKDLKPTLRRQFGYHVLMKTDYKDAEGILEVQQIPTEILQKIPRMNTGDALLATGIRWDYPIQFPPTRHKHVDPSFDVLHALGKKHGLKTHDVDLIFTDAFAESMKQKRQEKEGEDDKNNPYE